MQAEVTEEHVQPAPSQDRENAAERRRRRMATFQEERAALSLRMDRTQSSNNRRTNQDSQRAPLLNQWLQLHDCEQGRQRKQEHPRTGRASAEWFGAPFLFL